MLSNGVITNLNNFKDARIIHSNRNITISIAQDQTNPQKKYIFKTFVNKVLNNQQKIFVDTFTEISNLNIINSAVPVNCFAAIQNKNIFSFFNLTHYYESYSFIGFKSRLNTTFCSYCISEITLDKILKKQAPTILDWGFEDSMNCLFSVAIAMNRLHNNLIIHGNLCPSNILVDKAKQCYVSDFGLYKIKEVCYEPPFFSNEYASQDLAKDPFHPNQATDIFSYGVIMCRLLQEHLCQNASVNMIELFKNNQMEVFKNFPPYLSRIISLCLDPVPERRCNFSFIIETFKDQSFVFGRSNVSSLFLKFQHMSYLERLAKSDDSNALNILGDLFCDPSKAFIIKENPQSHKRNNISANSKNDSVISISDIKYDGKINERFSFICYSRSNSLGNYEGMANYGFCLVNGYGTPIDVQNGVACIKKSFEKKCLKGVYYFGLCNLYGIGMESPDYKRAEELLKIAAEGSDYDINNSSQSIVCRAKYHIGLLMETEKRYDEAARYFRMVAYSTLESNINFCSCKSFIFPEALYYYGRYLEKGIGIPPDATLAFQFYKMAHIQGNDDGSYGYAKLVLEEKVKFDKSSKALVEEEASLIMKSLAKKNNQKAIHFLSQAKLQINLGKNKDKSEDKKTHKSNEDKKASNKNKETKINEKIIEKFDTYYNDLTKYKNQKLLEYEKDYIESKNAHIIYKFATIYSKGEFVKQDIKKANDYYKLSAELGDSESQLIYGLLLLRGEIGVDNKKDIEGGLKMLLKSAKQNNINGMKNVYNFIMSDKSNDPNVARFVANLKEMADNGSNLAQLYYGKFLLKGSRKDPEQGARYVKMAYDAKVPTANYTYASCLLNGEGVPKDEKRAIEILESIVENENSKSAIVKCCKYYSKFDYKKALAFLEKGANLGIEDCMFRYGRELINGFHCEKNVKLGEEFLIKSKKDIQDYTFAYFTKDPNGNYVEIPSTSSSSMKKATDKYKDAFTDEDDNDDNDKGTKEPERKSKKHPATEEIKISNKPLTPDEKKQIDKKLISSLLKQRVQNSECPQGIDENVFITEAMNGDTDAMNYLGKILTSTQNEATQKIGAKLYSFSANRKDPTGMIEYGKILFNGECSIMRSSKKALEIFQDASQLYEIAEPNYLIAESFYNGIGTQRSKRQAFDYYVKAAELNHVPSMIRLAKYFKKGSQKTTKKDEKKMLFYLKKAIEINNSPEANYKLGKYYLINLKKPQKAFKYLKEASLNNNVKASFYLYKMSNDSDTKTIDKQEALNYLKSACKINYKPALKAYYEKYGRPFKTTETQTYDYSYDVQDLQNGDSSRGESVEDERQFFITNLSIDIDHASPQEFIEKGDEVLAKAEDKLSKAKQDIQNDSNSKSSATISLIDAQNEYEFQKGLALRCYKAAINKGYEGGYFKYASLTNDPEEALSYLQYAKDNNFDGADKAWHDRLIEIGTKAEEMYNKNERNGRSTSEYQKKMFDVANKFYNDDDFINAAVWYKKAGYVQSLNDSIDKAKSNASSLNGEQLFVLAQIIDGFSDSPDGSSHNSDNYSVLEQNGSEQKSEALELYKLAVEKGCKEAEPFREKLSKELLKEMSSKVDDSQGLNELGLCFLEGKKGVSVNYKKAASCFCKAASNGNVDAIVNYGKCLLFGTGITENDEKAFECFKKATIYCTKLTKTKKSLQKKVSHKEDSKSPTTSSDESDFDNQQSNYNESISSNLLDGMCYYAFCLMDGKGTPGNQKDEKQALVCFKKAASLGSVEAKLQYGINCINEPDGLKFLKEAADAGNPEAQFEYSKYLEDKDNSQSLKYLQTAAENNKYKPFLLDNEKITEMNKSAGYFQPAVIKWGNALFKNINRNTEAAIQYFKKLADAKNVFGLYMYAKCLEETDDDPDANYRKYYKEAADLGDADSQYLYANELINGGGDDDPSQCREISEYAKMSADQGHAKAAILYAKRLKDGKGVEKNLQEAIKYCDMALQKEPNGFYQSFYASLLCEAGST